MESFITILEVACEDATINRTLQELLVQPDHRRRVVVPALTERLRGNAAAPELLQAIACLLDDAVAERSYQVIFQYAQKAR